MNTNIYIYTYMYICIYTYNIYVSVYISVCPHATVYMLPVRRVGVACVLGSIRLRSIRLHTSAQHTSAYVCIRLHLYICSQCGAWV